MQDDLETEILLLISHVTSQLINRYIPLPFEVTGLLPCEDREVGAQLGLLSVKDWQEKILDYSDPTALPWVEPLLARKPDMLERISFYCHSELTIVNARRSHLIFYSSPFYPPLLREIADPPLVLTVVGDPARLLMRPVAIVGARKAGGFALRESYHLGKLMAEAGLLVVSGGAFGCDIAAHRGVLSAGCEPGSALVVFAGGLSSTYPRSNDFVFREVVARGGALVSERLWWAPPKPRDFAARNRIVSGICPTVFVMQAGERSGALVTARKALDQGRDVWVLEHEPGDIRARGGESLIDQGAQPFQGASGCPELFNQQRH